MADRQQTDSAPHSVISETSRALPQRQPTQLAGEAAAPTPTRHHYRHPTHLLPSQPAAHQLGLVALALAAPLDGEHLHQLQLLARMGAKRNVAEQKAARTTAKK
jgi:hypothetical protein